MDRQTERTSLRGNQHQTSVHGSGGLVRVSFHLRRDPKNPIGRGIVTVSTKSGSRSRNEGGRGRTETTRERYVIVDLQSQRTVTHSPTSGGDDPVGLTRSYSMLPVVLDRPFV